MDHSVETGARGWSRRRGAAAEHADACLHDLIIRLVLTRLSQRRAAEPAVGMFASRTAYWFCGRRRRELTPLGGDAGLAAIDRELDIDTFVFGNETGERRRTRPTRGTRRARRRVLTTSACTTCDASAVAVVRGRCRHPRIREWLAHGHQHYRPLPGRDRRKA